MNLEPSNQLKLFGHKENFNYLTNLFNKEIFPSKIILSGPDGIGKSTFAYHFINFVLSCRMHFARVVWAGSDF